MKKLIAAAVAGAFIAPAAFAASESNVTLYGSLRGFVDYVHTNQADNKNALKLNAGSSRIGFKGSDNLGNGTAVIWQVESAIGQNSGEGNWASRNSFVGLEGGFGTVRVGNYDSAYSLMDITGPQAELFDSYGDSVDYKQSYGFYGRANARMKNSLSYETPNLNGFTGRISYGSDNKANQGNNAWILSGSVTYTIGGFSVAGAYQQFKNHVDLVDDASAEKKVGGKLKTGKVAANYKFDNGLNIGAGWERIKVSGPNAAGASASERQDSWVLAANYPVGSWTLQAAYGQAGKVKENNGGVVNRIKGEKAKMLLLGTQYSLSKRSTLYGYVAHVKNNADAQFSVGNYDSLGLSAQAGNATTGNKGYTVSFGLKTDF